MNGKNDSLECTPTSLVSSMHDHVMIIWVDLFFFEGRCRSKRPLRILLCVSLPAVPPPQNLTNTNAASKNTTNIILVVSFIQMPKLLDLTEGLSRLHLPGSLVYALRPKGWGKTTLLHDLSQLLRGGNAAQSHFPPNTWIRKNKNILFRQPKMIPLLLQLSKESLRQEDVSAQFKRQLLDPAHTATAASADHINQMNELVDHCHYADAIALASKLHGGTRLAVLVDDFDAAFVPSSGGRGSGASGSTVHLLSQLCGSVEQKSGGGLLMMKGTFRPRVLHSVGLLQKMRDLSLDLNHSNTWGMSLSTDLDQQKEQEMHDRHVVQQKGYEWNEAQMSPVLRSPQVVAVPSKGAIKTEEHAAQRLRLNYSGGYWYGGCKTSTGIPEAMSSLRPWLPFPHRNELHALLFGGGGGNGNGNESMSIEQVAIGIETLVSGTYAMSTMDRYLNESVQVLPVSGDNNDHHDHHDDHHNDTNDWAVALLQAGVLTMASRSMRFDEFHTYAWCRTSFPNEKARHNFVTTVLQHVVHALAKVHAHGTNKHQATTPATQENQAFTWLEVERSIAELSMALRKDDNDNDSQKLVAARVQELIQYSHVMAQLLHIDVETCFKMLLLGVPHLHLDDQIGHSVADAGTALDTFSNKEDLLVSIVPTLTTWSMKCYALDGRVAVPSYCGSSGSSREQQEKEEQQRLPLEEGTMAFYNQNGAVCSVLKF
jgi:hypothetical protein